MATLLYKASFARIRKLRDAYLRFPVFSVIVPTNISNCTSANAYGHLRSLLTGNSCIFPIQNGSMIMGAAQEIVLMEFDGPQERTVFVDVIGE